MKPRRPFSVTLIACSVLIVTIASWARLWLSISEWNFLAGLLPFSPAYLSLSGFLWGLVGLPLLWGLWRGKTWAPRFIRLALLVFSLYYWGDRVLLSGYAERNINWPFALVINLIIGIWIFWILARPKTKSFFGDMNE
jgi:hypothetical protein